MDKMKFFSKLISTNADVLTEQNLKDVTCWSYEMEDHAHEFVERFCEVAQKMVDQLRKISTRC